MATVQDNMLMEGLSGMFGRSIVFKQFRGKTVVAARPSPPRKQSERQKANRSKFKEASSWAREVLQDATKKEYYQKKARKLNLPNAYTAAITDYMRRPVVKESFKEDDGTNYCVNKKGFALANVDVVVVKNNVREVRQAECLPGGDWNFLLGEEDKQAEVSLHVTDFTGRGFAITVFDPHRRTLLAKHLLTL